VVTTFVTGLVGPRGVALDGAGNLYVADYSQVVKITPDGGMTALATDLAGADSIAVDAAGNVFCGGSDAMIIQKITPAGVATILAGTNGQSGSTDGLGGAARFNRPMGGWPWTARGTCLWPTAETTRSGEFRQQGW